MLHASRASRRRIAHLSLLTIALIGCLTPRGAMAKSGVEIPFVLTTTSCEELPAMLTTSGQASKGLLSGLIGVSTGVLGIALAVGLVSSTTTSVLVYRHYKQVSLLEEVLRQQEADLRHASALGAGPMVEDLAHWLGLEERDARRALGARLRARRPALLAALRAPTSWERAQQTLMILQQLERDVRSTQQLKVVISGLLVTP